MFESFLGINFLNLYDTDAFLAIQLILTLMINCAIFKRMTDIRISWTVFLTLALLDVVIQYNITNMIMVFDVFILMILAFLAKGKTWSVTQYAFHTLFPVVTSDLLYRLLGLFFIPLLLNLPVAEVGSNALFYLLSYGLILPLYFVFDRFLGLDLKRWKVYSDDSFQNLQISRRVAIAMAIYLLGIYLSVNLDSWFPGYSSEVELRLRMLWVLLSAVAFIFLIAHLNQLSRQYLEESLVSSNDEREQTLNQLLTEMDGFQENIGVIILAATNRPETLDPALTRPGRFDRRVPVELPDLAGREAILKVHAKKIKTADDVNFHTIARMASGASGAELANIINEAALRAVRNNRTVVNESDLEESIETVIAGYQKKNAVLSDSEKKVVAYHEIGHALVAAMQSHSAPVQKITIIPRTSGALGYTMQVDQDDKYLLTKQELENKIATFTGGRAAEELVFGEITTGASNDIEQATKLARAMITRYGMSEDFDMVALETVSNQYLGGDASLACSADTQNEIDRKVVELVKRQHEKASKILADNRGKLDELAKYPCAISVARAAPNTPRPSPATIQRSIKIFNTDEKIRRTNGILDSPMEVNIVERMLYINRNGNPTK